MALGGSMYIVGDSGECLAFERVVGGFRSIAYYFRGATGDLRGFKGHCRGFNGDLGTFRSLCTF